MDYRDCSFYGLRSPYERPILFDGKPDPSVPDGQGTANMVGRVLTPDSKIAAGRFLMVQPVSVFGPEVEGGAPALDDLPGPPVAVYLVGPRSARQGDLLICRFVNYRWVAERGGTTGVEYFTIAGCPCTTIPAAIYLHVAFQPDHVQSLVFSSPLQRMPMPPELAQYNPDAVGYYSTTALWSSDQLCRFRYWLGCARGVYNLFGLMTPDSPLGYPGRFGIMSWLVGLPGNTCSPFRLANGSSASQLYLSQGITIDTIGNG